MFFPIYLGTSQAGLTPRLDTTDLIIGTEGRRKEENIRLLNIAREIWSDADTDIGEINTHFLPQCGRIFIVLPLKGHCVL